MLVICSICRHTKTIFRRGQCILSFLPLAGVVFHSLQKSFHFFSNYKLFSFSRCTFKRAFADNYRISSKFSVVAVLSRSKNVEILCISSQFIFNMLAQSGREKKKSPISSDSQNLLIHLIKNS